METSTTLRKQPTFPANSVDNVPLQNVLLYTPLCVTVVGQSRIHCPRNKAFTILFSLIATQCHQVMSDLVRQHCVTVPGSTRRCIEAIQVLRGAAREEDKGPYGVLLRV